LALEKLHLTLDTVQAGKELPNITLGAELTGLVGNVRTYLPVEERGGDPFAEATGYLERAYISVIDGGVQPYLVGVPDGALKAAQPAPLVIFLHGYDPTIDKNRWWEAKDFAATCGRNGCFLAIPFARSNTDFQTCGEVDVLDVVAEMKRHYRIDPERVYLYGYSMGGMGVYTLAAHHPDDFAAGIVMAGRADNPLQNYSAVENFHPFKQLLIRSEQPLALCENLLNFPLRIYHGNDDPVVPKSEALRMAARFKELGADAQLFLKPGGHGFGFDLLLEDEPLQWLLSKKRLAETASCSRVMNVYSLSHAKQGALTVFAYSGGLDAIRIKWTEQNGMPHIAEKSPNVLSIVERPAPLPPAEPGAKSPGLCGPVRQAICAPFTLVYGTIGNAAANALNKHNAERFAAEWFAFTRSKAVLKADTEISPDEMKARNLFLFGEEQDNAIHKAAAPNLPIAVKNGSVTIAGQTDTLSPNRGVIYVAPNPLPGCAGRAVVILAGLPYGDKLGANHKLDLIPDFLFYDDTFDIDGTSTNHALCAGYFNGRWKLDPQTTWRFAPQK
jgi:pimeloyl-ACP methyl ester carboxylesterase